MRSGSARRKCLTRPPDDDADQLPELSVMASGNLGLISFPREPGRLTLERIEELYPALIPALREHPGIGFLLVRSERDGAVVLGSSGRQLSRRGPGRGRRTRSLRSAPTQPRT